MWREGAGLVRIADFFQPARIAIQFLTCLPMGDTGKPTASDLGASVSWYPFVGLLIGGCLLMSAALMAPYLSAPLIAALLLLMWVILTGALHLDGLADCADAWVGGMGSRKRTLMILKDPNCGAVGVTTLVMALLLKWVLLTDLMAHSANVFSWGWIGLLLVPMLSRLAACLLMIVTPCATPSGLGASVSEQVSRPFIVGWAGLLLALGIVYAPWLTLLLYFVNTLLIIGIRYGVMRRLDGYTGDALGALIEFAELLGLLACLVWIATNTAV